MDPLRKWSSSQTLDSDEPTTVDPRELSIFPQPRVYQSNIYLEAAPEPQRDTETVQAQPEWLLQQPIASYDAARAQAEAPSEIRQHPTLGEQKTQAYPGWQEQDFSSHQTGQTEPRRHSSPEHQRGTGDTGISRPSSHSQRPPPQINSYTFINSFGPDPDPNKQPSESDKQSSKGDKRPLKSSDKSYACEVCGLDFTRAAELLVHRRTHGSNESRRKYFCDFPGCPKSYFDSSSLNRHKALHKNEVAYEVRTRGGNEDV